MLLASAVSDCGRSYSLCVLTLGLLIWAPVPTPAQAPADSEWREFQGTWTAVGKRRVIPLGGDRRASIADFDGSLMLTGASRPALGFRAEAVVFNDTLTGMAGRAVWTDERGDQLFSELRGQTALSTRIVGTFLGGSGRYKGATGSYQFSWRFLLEDKDGDTVQGQSMDLNGQVRAGAPPGALSPASSPS